MKPIFLDPPFDSVCFYVFFCFGDFLGNGDPFGDVFIIFRMYRVVGVDWVLDCVWRSQNLIPYPTEI